MKARTASGFFQTLLFTTLSAVFPTEAAVITWTNAGNGNWNVTNNWSPNHVPSTNDTAAITGDGTYTVTLNVNPTIAGLWLGGSSGTQTLATAGKTLTLNGAGLVNVRGCLLLSGGTISGTNAIRVAGELAWQSGTVDTNAVVVVTDAGSVNIASPGNHVKLLHGCLTNDGTVTWQNYGNLAVGGTLYNREGGLFDAQLENRNMDLAAPDGVIINDGHFRKSVSSSIVSCAVPLVNRGTVDNRAGTLVFAGGSVLGAGSMFIGDGVTRFAGGTNVLYGDLYGTNLVLRGTTLTGTGRISGVVTWDYGGMIGGGAAITVTTNGHLLLSSSDNFTRYVYGNLTNAGTVTFSTYGNLAIGGRFHNLAGALFDVRTDNRTILLADPAGVIINDGVLRRSTGGQPVFCEVPVINRGRVEALTGTVQFADAFNNSSGTIALAGGTVQMLQPLMLSGGLLSGWGTLDADVTNAAVVRPSPTNGGLMVNGDYVQTLAGTTVFELGGNLPGTNQSRLAIAGSAYLSGCVNVELAEGYLPAPGTHFPVMSFGLHKGEFDCHNGLFLLGHGRRLTPTYALNALTLSVLAEPDPAAVPLSVTVEDGSALVAWPLEFMGYELYWSTNLAQTNWTLRSGITNRYIEAPPLPPEKYFRLFPL